MTLSSKANFHVNFLSCKDDELLQATERLWKSDFERGTSVLNVPNSKEDRAAYDVMVILHYYELYIIHFIMNYTSTDNINLFQSFRYSNRIHQN